MNHRRPLVGGNWKMNHLSAEVSAFLERFVPALGEPAADVVLFPSFPWIPRVAAAVADSSAACGGQDLHPADKGAHTGDVSAPQLADAGCTWVLCGHSERRQDHRESDALVGDKAAAAERAGLRPLICVGETAEERSEGRTFDVLARQLAAALALRPRGFSLAYEPVWAIGTGQTATPQIAQETHAFLRETLADLVGDETAAAKRILYGGSVKPDNAAELAAQADIDGFLIGGASLDAETFLAIVDVYR